MHRGLGILEIVEIICAQLGLESSESLSTDASSALSALARTSQFFHNPALNVLWRHQDTLVNLIRCMPEDLWDITQGSDDEDDDGPAIGTSIQLLRIMQSSDWDRPQFYMPRVKSLSVMEAFDTPEFLETLSLSLPGETFFPRLETLHWHPKSDLSVFHHVRSFLTPHITDLSLGCDSFSHLSVLSTLAAKCPSLTRVTITTDFSALIGIMARSGPGGSGQKIFAPAISTLVLALPQIRSLQVPWLDDRAVAHLARMPDLSTLHLEFGLPRTAPPVENLGFTTLTELTVRTMKCALRLLNVAANSPLEKFTIMATSLNPSETMAREFYATLLEHCSHSSLREITIGGEFDEDIEALSTAEIATFLVGGDVLRPLFSFPNLIEVRLAHPVGFNLDDAMMHDLARAWPQIEVLGLTARPYRHVPSRVSLEGLYAFAKHCPHLRILALTFDATVVPKLRDNGKKRVTQRSLCHLNVAASPIRKPERVAKFLSAMFPCLMDIATLHGDRLNDLSEDEGLFDNESVTDSSELWEDVEYTLIAFTPDSEKASKPRD
ncbi:hypothetical protein B0H13DRAFT_1988642 [Mycena leptocephala]|nr:hypothetical protein B0H13DRAFT_1988642 [Mycena leptocephala]